jgi:glycosyltransferase involved in cell wall biosynthesis
MKTIYLEPPWKPLLWSDILVTHPPQGYRFVAPQDAEQRLFQLAAKRDISYLFQRWVAGRMPVGLVKAYLEKFKPIPREANLTYAITHLVLRKEPWVLDMGNEVPHLLAGTEAHLDKYKGTVKRALASPYCKKIIFWVETGREGFLSQVGQELEGKTEVVYGAVPPRRFTKRQHGDKVKLLFVNSGNINTARHFYAKGGREVVEAFVALAQRHSNLELVIRSGMPRGLKDKCCRIPSVRVIDKPVPWAELEREWKTADIFVLPNHCNTPAMAFLDAMSYELPIVTGDIWANHEIVADGRTGFLVPHSRVAEYADGPLLSLGSAEFKRVLDATDPDMLQGLVEKLSILIENPELRRQMGSVGRWEAEHGKFSLEKRNEKLKGILDEATS